MRSKEQEPAEYDEGTGTYEGRGAEGNDTRAKEEDRKEQER
jgi:hypothetical protein